MLDLLSIIYYLGAF